MTMLKKASRAVGEVAATMVDDVRHVLSERAIEDIARAALMAVRVPDVELPDEVTQDFVYPDDIAMAFTAMIDHILNEEPK